MSWPTIPLDELVDIQIGKTPSRAEPAFWGPGYPWLSIADMGAGPDIQNTKETITDFAVQRCKMKLIPAGTVLLSFKLSIGKVGRATKPIYTNEAIAALPRKPSAPVDEQYLAWALRSINLTRGQDRAAMGLTLNKPKLQALQIPVPPLDEQRRIAAILDQADALRRKRKQAIREIDRLGPAVFVEMFGNPVRNEMGWPSRHLGDLVDGIDSGWSPNCLDRAALGDEWAVLKLGAVTYGRFDTTANKALPEGVEPRGHLEVHPGDLLFTRKNTYELVGACALVRETRPRLLLPDLIFRLRLKEKHPAHSEYICALMSHPEKRAEIRSLASGAAGSMPNISKRRLETLSIPLPPLELQAKFASPVLQAEVLRAQAASQEVQLRVAFASLQHRAFRGEL